MASAAEWVRQTVASSQDQPMTTEAVLKSLERHVGQGDRARERVQAILEYIGNARSLGHGRRLFGESAGEFGGGVIALGTN